MRTTTSVSILMMLIIHTGSSYADGELEDLNGNLQKLNACGDFESAVSVAMPCYRKFASERLETPSVRDFAWNLALIYRSQRAVTDILKRSISDNGAPLVDGKLLHRSLTAFGRARPVNAEGLTEQEVLFLSNLYGAVAQSSLQKVIELADQAGKRGEEYLYVYLVVAMETAQGDELLWTLPERLQKMPGAKVFADYCVTLGRRDLAAQVYRTLGRKAANPAECEGYLRLAFEEYLKMEDIAHGIDLWRELVKRFPNSMEAESAQAQIVELNAEKYKAYGTAAEECEIFLKMFPKSGRAVEYKLRVASLKYQAADYTGAINCLDRLKADPSMSGTEGEQDLLRGICLIGKGESAAGLDVLDRFIRAQNGHVLAPRAMLIMANTNISLQEYAKANDLLKRLIDAYPKSEYTEKAKELTAALGRIGQSADGAKSGNN